MLTGDVQIEKYVYYRCAGNRGKCDLARFREEVLSERLGEPLKGFESRPKSSLRLSPCCAKTGATPKSD
jgi:hypothetical protein